MTGSEQNALPAKYRFHELSKNSSFASDKFRIVRQEYSFGKGYQEHVNDYYVVYIICSGTMNAIMNGKQMSLGRGTIRLAFPKDIIRFNNLDGREDLVMLVIDVSGDEVMRNFQFMAGGGAWSMQDCRQTLQDLPEWQFKFFCDTVLKLLAICKSKRPAKAMGTVLWHTFMQNLLGALFMRSFSDDADAQPIWLEEAFHEMLKRENFTAGIGRMMKICGRSHAHVTRMMRKYYGMTPQQFVNGLRLEYASEQLCKSDWSITDIAFGSGFNNLAYFRKCFESKYEMTPREFRQRWRGETS